MKVIKVMPMRELMKKTPKKPVNFIVSMSADLRKALKVRAATLEITMNQLIVNILELDIEKSAGR